MIQFAGKPKFLLSTTTNYLQILCEVTQSIIGKLLLQIWQRTPTTISANCWRHHLSSTCLSVRWRRILHNKKAEINGFPSILYSPAAFICKERREIYWDWEAHSSWKKTLTQLRHSIFFDMHYYRDTTWILCQTHTHTYTHSGNKYSIILSEKNKNILKGCSWHTHQGNHS